MNFARKSYPIKIFGILEYIASKHENIGQFFQVSVVFHPHHSEMLLTKIYFSVVTKFLLLFPLILKAF